MTILFSSDKIDTRSTHHYKKDFTMFDKIMTSTTVSERIVGVLSALSFIVSSLVHLVYGLSTGVEFSGATLTMIISFIALLSLMFSHLIRRSSSL